MAKILVVDDKEDVCKTVRAVLEKRGHTVHTAQTVPDGVEALERTTSSGRAYHVAVIDLRFENSEGAEPERYRAGMDVLKSALAVPFLEPIVMTAYPSAITAAEALEKGVFRYVAKGNAAGHVEEDPGMNEGFLGQLEQAVELAVENREVMRTLDESLSMLSESLDELRSDDDHHPLVDQATNYLEFAQRAYGILLKARGRHL